MPSTFCEGFHSKDDLKKITYKQLGKTDMMVSTISFGATGFGNLYRQTNDEENKKVLLHALKSGINMIDTAPWYGNGKSETTLGNILQDVARSSYYLNTKVCRYEPTFGKMFDFSAERTLRSVDESLMRLKTDHIDIIQVHDMEFAKNLDVIINETLPALKKVKESGKVRYIGITGYPLENFKYVIDRSPVKIDSILTYCHGSMNDSSLANYMPYLKEKEVGVINGSILSMGLLTERGPPSWHPATNDIKHVCKQASDYCKTEGVDISKLGSDYSFKFEGVDTTLIGTASYKNLDSNLNVYTNGLNVKEFNVRETIMSKFFNPIVVKDWEGLELQKYRRAIKEGRYNDTL